MAELMKQVSYFELHGILYHLNSSREEVESSDRVFKIDSTSWRCEGGEVATLKYKASITSTAVESRLFSGQPYLLLLLIFPGS